MGEDVVYVRYRGAVTVGSPGRARLHDHDRGISELIWDALREAGWTGQLTGVKPTLYTSIRVERGAPAEAETVRSSPLPGGPRRPVEPAHLGDDGRFSHRYEGPLHARAVPGMRVAEEERRPEDFDSYEDLLFDAARRAGWMPDDLQQLAADIPDVEIVIGITRYDPREHA